MVDRTSVFETYKARYSMPDVVQIALRQSPVKSEAGGVLFYCPFHPDSGRPNLHVKQDYATCFSGQCSFWGDIFQFLERLLHLSRKEALVWLDNNLGNGLALNAQLQSIPTRPVEHQVIKPRYAAYDEANRLHHNLISNADALSYFTRRNISQESIDKFILGWEPETHRYVIPNLNHVGTYGFKRRRDDAWCRQEMQRRGQAWLDEQLAEIWQARMAAYDRNGLEPVIPTFDDVLKRNFPKYLWRKDDVIWLFNEERLMNEPLPYVMITADEMSAITLEQAGYNAVCWPSDRAMPRPETKFEYWWNNKSRLITIRDVFKRAAYIYLVADNDTSGLTAAAKRLETLGRGQIITTPMGKDPNDFAVMGGHFEDWLQGVPRR